MHNRGAIMASCRYHNDACRGDVERFTVIGRSLWVCDAHAPAAYNELTRRAVSAALATHSEDSR